MRGIHPEVYFAILQHMMVGYIHFTMRGVLPLIQADATDDQICPRWKYLFACPLRYGHNWTTVEYLNPTYQQFEMKG